VEALSLDLPGTPEVRATLEAPITALLGPSGAGKSTLLMLIAGLQRPAQGRIQLGSRVLVDTATRTWLPAWKRRVGLVFQDQRLWPHQRVADQIRYGGRFREEEVIHACELGPLLERRPGELSGGERQRVALARTLMSKPAILLLDEPLSGVDQARRTRILRQVSKIRAALDIPLVVVTHQVADALELTDHVWLLDAGRQLGLGPLHRVVEEPVAFEAALALGLESSLLVEVVGTDPAAGYTRAWLGEHALGLPPLERPLTGPMRVGVRPEDVLLALAPLRDVSARNALPATVSGVRQLGERWLVDLDVGQPLLAEVTREAVEGLRLQRGLKVWAYIKTWAFRFRG
jgi:molybdate transport system ATP-binding protein